MTIMNETVLTPSWEKLEKDQLSNSPTTLVFPDNDSDMYISIKNRDSEKREFHMIMDSQLMEPGLDLPRGKGFSISVGIDDITHQKQKSKISISLNDINSKDIFDVMIIDLATHIDSLGKNSVKSFVNRILQWQKFIENDKLPLLSEHQQRGLYGELNCLKKYLFECLNVTNGLKSWIGPEKAVHDFEWSGVGIEVKTTITKNPKTFTVTSEEQLDKTYLNQLFIYLLCLDKTKTIGESLADVVDEIYGLLNDYTDKTLFNQKLFQSGYSNEFHSHYKKIKYNTQQEIIYTVEDDFPSITNDDLKNGVSHVNYSVSIDTCGDFELNPSDLKCFFNNE